MNNSDEPTLGSCCICGADQQVRNIMMLDVKNQVPGHGWGCLICNLPADGASAVLCDRCLELFQEGKAKIKYACRGYPAIEGRVPIEELSIPHEHDHDLHHRLEA
jgi:hypothetical protein